MILALISCAVFLIVFLFFLRLSDRLGRSAADPDKETPPPGWTVTGTTASGKSTARPKPSPACFAVEPLPVMPPEPPIICAACGGAVGDTETVMVRADRKIVPPIGKARTPSVAKLIHLLIEERAKVIAFMHSNSDAPTDRDRDQARREIEAENVPLIEQLLDA